MQLQLFRDKFVFPGNEEIERPNFDSFAMSFLAVFQIVTGENWNDVSVFSRGVSI